MTGGADAAGTGGIAAVHTGCLQKPFALDELRRFVASALRPK